jgi:catechol 2,3-dioxygenase-like lactoylglutathione lyase family enzyme
MQQDERASAEADRSARAIPVLPARDLVRTKRFYQRLGFRDVGGALGLSDWPDDYLVLRAGAVELQFFLWPDLDPEQSAALCDIDTEDADALHRLWSRLGLPDDGFPRLSPIADTPWGRRRFVMVDPDGNRLSCGQAARRGRAFTDEARLGSAARRPAPAPAAQA